MVNEPLDRAARERELDAVTELHRVNLSPENRFEASPFTREFQRHFCPSLTRSHPFAPRLNASVNSTVFCAFIGLIMSSCMGSFDGATASRIICAGGARVARSDVRNGAQVARRRSKSRYSAAIKAKPWGHRKVAPSSIERPDARTAPKRILAVRHFASETDRDGKRAFSIRAASPSFALSCPILLRSRLA